MRRFMRPARVPGPPAHPLVIELVREMNRQRIGPRDLAERAGVGHSVLHTWVRRADRDVRTPNNDKIGPMVLTLEAMGNALGLELVWRRKGG